MSAPAALELRVWVTDVWDTVTVAATPGLTVAGMKAVALQQAMGRPFDAADHEVKYRGALIADERQTLADLHVPNHAPFIVLPARRQPVR
ncbi:MAG TPA: hypothetical protein VGI83_08175 [Gemmatimonadales bacterium]|jgi:hypothetical protein